RGNSTLPAWKGAVFTKVAPYLPFICKVIGVGNNEGCSEEDLKTDQSYHSWP
ncbi:hypothetical protein AAVH_12781, partial [Aphelenchoides avenae]